MNQDVLFEYDSFTLSSERRPSWKKRPPGWLKTRRSRYRSRGTAMSVARRPTIWLWASVGPMLPNSIWVPSALTPGGCRRSAMEKRPPRPRHTEDAWSRNRRAHFVITSQ